jgi:hypothetical protein
MSLDDLVTQLKQAHGASLVGIVLYGSKASDEKAGGADHNVLVIVESLAMETLRSLGQTARAWQEAGNPPPLFLTREEWLGSADVFPMEYADILERHRVLAGTLPLEGIVVDATDLRLQVEQEALGKLLRLRRAVMLAGTDIARQRALMRESLSAMLVILRGVLRLHGEHATADSRAVILRAAVLCGFDEGPFTRVYQSKQETENAGDIADADVEQVLAGYVRGAQALVAYLDRFVPPSRGG